MAHGAGGKATQSLIEGLLLPAFGGAQLEQLGDAALVEELGVAVTTDSFVVKPIRFPGGSIGELAVNGTVNDLAVSGARPLALTVSLVLEEGLDRPRSCGRDRGDRRARPRRPAWRSSAGDTKVVERGHADSMYICTTGIGRPDPRGRLSTSGLEPGDRILISGPVGDHGTAIMLARGEFELEADDRVGHALALAGGRRAARGGRRVAPLHARRHPRRRGVACSTSWRARPAWR